jgi:hypothetical protein
VKESEALKESFDERMKEAQGRRNMALRVHGSRKQERRRKEDVAEKAKAKVEAKNVTET